LKEIKSLPRQKEVFKRKVFLKKKNKILKRSLLKTTKFLTKAK